MPVNFAPFANPGCVPGPEPAAAKTGRGELRSDLAAAAMWVVGSAPAQAMIATGKTIYRREQWNAQA